MRYLNKLSIFLSIVGMMFCLVVPTNIYSQALKASLAIMPLSAEIDKDGDLSGAYINLIYALDRVTKSKTDITLAPFQRSISNLIKKDADFHIPLIRTPQIDEKTLPYTFSTETLFEVAFVLYTHKNKPLDINNLNQYRIATDIAHTKFFPFPVIGKSCLSCTIKMVDKGRIDGFIFAQNETDPFIEQFKLKNIHRQLYKYYDVKILIPKTEEGKTIDKYFSRGIKLLKQNDKFDKILSPLVSPYIDWQP